MLNCARPILGENKSDIKHWCRTLGALAEKCHAYAKALHYKELEFKTSPELCVEALISINNQLRQPEAAIGILTYAQQTLHMELKVFSGAQSTHSLSHSKEMMQKAGP